MAEVGILKPHDRVELIRGEIIEMSPIGRRHAAFVDNLTELLITRLAGRAIVSVQNPVAVSADSEPQPDLKLLRRRRVPYKDVAASAGDVLLLIEVAFPDVLMTLAEVFAKARPGSLARRRC